MKSRAVMPRGKRGQNQGNQAVERRRVWAEFIQGFATGGACSIIIALLVSSITTESVAIPKLDVHMRWRALVSRVKKDQKQGNQAVRKRYDWTEFFGGFITGATSLILIALIASFITIRFVAPPDPDVTLPRSQVVLVNEGRLAGSVVVRYVGTISKPGVAFIEKEFEKLPKERPIWLSMQSGGGDIEAADMLLQYITAAHIGLAIPDGGQCASACTLLYAVAAPEYRFASPNTYFGFHYGTSTTLLFNFGNQIINSERFFPMTLPNYLESFASDIPNRKTDLATFFNSCSKGDPTHSRRVVYLSYRQITSIVQDRNEVKCDGVVAQDTTWFFEQVAPFKTLSKGADQ